MGITLLIVFVGAMVIGMPLAFVMGGAGLAALGVASVGSRSALAQEVRYFRIGTGETGGSLFVLGGVIAAVVSNPPGSRACPVCREIIRQDAIRCSSCGEFF